MVTLQSQLYVEYVVGALPVTPLFKAILADTFAPDTYWRGNVWSSVNWLVHRGLRRCSYDAQADALALCKLALLEQSRFWEYYHSLTDQSLRGARFSWTAILLDTAVADEAKLTEQ